MELTRGDSINIDMVGPKIVEFFQVAKGSWSLPRTSGIDICGACIAGKI